MVDTNDGSYKLAFGAIHDAFELNVGWPVCYPADNCNIDTLETRARKQTFRGPFRRRDCRQGEYDTFARRNHGPL